MTSTPSQDLPPHESAHSYAALTERAQLAEARSADYRLKFGHLQRFLADLQAEAEVAESQAERPIFLSLSTRIDRVLADVSKI